MKICILKKLNIRKSYYKSNQYRGLLEPDIPTQVGGWGRGDRYYLGVGFNEFSFLLETKWNRTLFHILFYLAESLVESKSCTYVTLRLSSALVLKKINSRAIIHLSNNKTKQLKMLCNNWVDKWYKQICFNGKAA